MLASAATTATNIAEYTVTEIAFALKRTVEDAFGLVRVRGEMSGFKRAASGHLYFTLKDEKACLDAVAWRTSTPRLTSSRRTGSRWSAPAGSRPTRGAPSTSSWSSGSSPRAPVPSLALLEERKKKLAAEGLFDPGRKRPFLPAVVGVVTSPTGAVIRDILHRLADQFPCRVLVWPVLVQGEGAAEQVAAAIRGFSGLPEAGGPVPRPDVVIVARGGGSIEDLWAFNDEAVVRAAAESVIPLISAVGHETDADRPRVGPPGARPRPRRWRPVRPGDRRPRRATTRWRGGWTSSASGWRASRAGCRGRTWCSGWRRSGWTTWRRGCAAPPSWCGLGERLEARAAELVELLRDLLKRCFRPRLPRRPADPELLASRLEQVRPRLDREAKGLANAIAAVLERAGKALDVPAPAARGRQRQRAACWSAATRRRARGAPGRRAGTTQGSGTEARSGRAGPAAVSERGHRIDRLLAVMRRLRDPERGCPWDVEQSFATIAPYTIEEPTRSPTRSCGRTGTLPGELGDLLLQVVYHARMGEAGLVRLRPGRERDRREDGRAPPARVRR